MPNIFNELRAGFFQGLETWRANLFAKKPCGHFQSPLPPVLLKDFEPTAI